MFTRGEDPDKSGKRGRKVSTDAFFRIREHLKRTSSSKEFESELTETLLRFLSTSGLQWLTTQRLLPGTPITGVLFRLLLCTVWLVLNLLRNEPKPTSLGSERTEYSKKAKKGSSIRKRSARPRKKQVRR